MKLTNKYDLPPPFLEAIRRDPYSKGNAAFSVTELIDSPRVSALKRRHYPDIEVDAADLVWSLIGRAVHDLLERYGRRADLADYVEERLFATVDGWRISGGMDLWLPAPGAAPTITDYKFTKARSTFGKIEWERQLNLYAWLYEVNKGVRVGDLQVCAIIRDWSKEQAQAQASYPQAPIWRVPVPLWSFEQQEAYVKERVRLHASVAASEAFGEEPPPCTDEERWKRSGTWVLMKTGNKRATAKFTNAEEAQEAFTLAQGQAKKGVEFTLDFRPATPTRCLNYCDVARFCSQWGSERESIPKPDLEIGDED